MSDNDTNKSPTETPRGFGEYRSKPKPLRWRTGPVEEGELKEQHIIKNRNGNYQLVRGWTVQDWEKYIPLSDILDLIGGE